MDKTHSVSRRTFLAASGALPFMLRSAAAQSRIPVGLELYSVRNELMKDQMATVRTVAKMGYQVVEFYSPYYQWTTETAKEIRKLMDDLGIRCLSTHNGGPSFSAEGMQKAIDLNQIIGSKAIIQASAPRAATADDWKAFAAGMTAAVEKLRPLGMTAGFHNHATEWRPFEGGRLRPMDVLAANTPRDFILQFDVGTCVEAGADPVAWITANPGRIKSMHCKDWGKGEGRGYGVLFGEGDVQWPAIFKAAEAVGGVECYLIEQEAGPVTEQFQRSEKCLANYKKMRG
jgi:sugar phosphate isomerase/epimerase